MLTKPTMETQQRKGVLRAWLAREDQEYQKALAAAGIQKPALLRLAGEVFEQSLRETALTVATNRLEALPEPKLPLLVKSDFGTLCESLWERLHVMNVRGESTEMRRGLDYAVDMAMRRTVPQEEPVKTILRLTDLLLTASKGNKSQSVFPTISDDLRDELIRTTETPGTFIQRFRDEAIAAAMVGLDASTPPSQVLTKDQKEILREWLRPEVQRIWKSAAE